MFDFRKLDSKFALGFEVDWGCGIVSLSLGLFAVDYYWGESK